MYFQKFVSMYGTCYGSKTWKSPWMLPWKSPWKSAFMRVYKWDRVCRKIEKDEEAITQEVKG